MVLVHYVTRIAYIHNIYIWDIYGTNLDRSQQTLMQYELFWCMKFTFML